MNPLVRFSSLALLVLIVGCGSSSMMSPNTPPPNTPNSVVLAGNFGLSVASQTNPATTYQIGGPLQSNSSGAVTGTVRIETGSSCFDPTLNVAVNGTITSAGQLTLTAIFQTQTITLNAMVSADGKTISGGTYTIAGGCAAGDHGTFSGFQVPMINGTYVGTFSAGGSTVSMSLQLSQSAANNFALSGKATFSNGSSCGLTTANILAGETGFITGADIKTTLLDPSLTVVGGFGGLVTDSTAHTINGTVTLTSGACLGTFAQVSLTMQ